LSRLLPIAAAALLAACKYADPCFTPQSKVEDLRVLAISVDPAEPAVDLAAGSVEPVRLRALIAHAGGSSGTFNVSWSLCVPGEQPGCPEGTSIAADREWTRDSQIELRVPAGLIAAAAAADPLRGLAGIRVLAMLRVEGATPASASTPILFSSSLGQRNQAPAMVGLRFATATEPPADALDPLPLVVGRPTGLRPVLAPGALEEYDTTDFSGTPVHLQERVRYSFYGTPGLAIGRLDYNGIAPAPLVFYPGGNDSEAEEPPPGTPESQAGLILVEAVRRGNFNGTLWIVARDSRGGVSWREVRVSSVEEDPACQGPPPRNGCAQLDFGCF